MGGGDSPVWWEEGEVDNVVWWEQVDSGVWWKGVESPVWWEEGEEVDTLEQLPVTKDAKGLISMNAV